jgi:signal transduction histidine kinase
LKLVETFNARTTLWIALRKNGVLLGDLGFYRQEVRPFTDKQIALLQNFAAQAVIAMENARLITETREALEQQTATAEVLQVINSSPGDLAPVFDAILERAHSLCGAPLGSLVLRDGDQLRAVATRGYPQEYETLARQGFPPTIPFKLFLSGEPFVHILDGFKPPTGFEDHPMRRAAAEIAGVRTVLFVPLRKDETVVGYISAQRQEVRSFTDKQIALLQNFAAQAVIAMENARLIGEQREALEQQTATAEVLEVINNSPGDLRPVFQALLQKAHTLCEASFGALMTYDGERFRAAAHHGIPAPFREFLGSGILPGRGDPFRLIVDGAAFAHTHDLLEVVARYPSEPLPRAAADLGGIRTLLVVPLRKDSELLGVITAYRQEMQPFSDKQIALLQNFSAQAVIAMENARLINETREALEQQTATAEVLQAINASQGDLGPVFKAILEKAHILCGATKGAFITFDDERFQVAATRGLSDAYSMVLRSIYNRSVHAVDAYDERSPRQQLMRGADLVHLTGPAVAIGPVGEAAVELEKIGTVLFLPLRRDGTLLGYITSYREEVSPFSEKQIVVLRSFAAQAVVAIENARLLNEIRTARDAAEGAYRDLKAAQASLIQAEKMASLGQLTAGIAHEIKNPLNFVNNFAELSGDLLDELHDAVAGNQQTEIDELTATLKGNLAKIAEHGRRADGIVRSMLEHSRGSSGERRSVNLNTLVDEALNLAYHGARAQDQSFNITLRRDFGEGIAPITLVPQDITRVLLNLFSNGFYAARRRHGMEPTPGFEPTLGVATRERGDTAEIRVRDNGIGIPEEVRDKLFQPFFTTKPTGEGTGLGLSISYDIVTQQHGGSITVDSKVGEFTEFVVTLPRK